ncbi:type II toxin-antitoxin system RelE/ParE family toxin [Polaribacter sp. Hel_I_88]|uniref:type II toxin-antitoxin system RelE/ParE family toxin n=1 Tax=Polaribacter sp. Hel_I_88 TaxID=1250006 RepID=UPI00047919BD|nr:type II toxin-antitoxin system RelE/ParE family toxin [Polaribacter sp. Hel_I_88]
MKLLSYKLSKKADFDLEEIFEHTEITYGYEQAIFYLTHLENLFENLVLQPEIGRQRNQIKKGLFSITEQEHTIFYRIFESNIRIVRVLHGRRDLARNFKN